MMDLGKKIENNENEDSATQRSAAKRREQLFTTLLSEIARDTQVDCVFDSMNKQDVPKAISDEILKRPSQKVLLESIENHIESKYYFEALEEFFAYIQSDTLCISPEVSDTIASQSSKSFAGGDGSLDPLMMFDDRKFLETMRDSTSKKGRDLNTVDSINYNRNNEYIIEVKRCTESFPASDKVSIFIACIFPIAARFEPLTFAQLVVLLCSHLNQQQSVSLLSNCITYVKRVEYAFSLFNIQLAQCLLKENKFEKAVSILKFESEEVASFSSNQWPRCILAKLHYAYATLYENEDDYRNMFVHLHLYLTYSKIREVPVSERADIVTKATYAAIISPKVYDFGELIVQPLLKHCLAMNLVDKWVFEILFSLHEGDIVSMNSLVKTHQLVFNKSPLGKCEKEIHNKAVLLALSEVIYTQFCEIENRKKFTFSEIADTCQIQIDDVEYYIIMAFNHNLIRGEIDQVEKIINIDWVRPRTTGTVRLQRFKKKIESLRGNMGDLIGRAEKIKNLYSPMLTAAAQT